MPRGGAIIRPTKSPPHNRDMPLVDEDFMRLALELAAAGPDRGPRILGTIR